MCIRDSSIRDIVPPEIPGIISAAPIARPLAKIINLFFEGVMRPPPLIKAQKEHLLVCLLQILS